MEKRLIGIISFLLILLPLNVNALSGNVSVSCNKTKLSANESTTCSIKANTQEGVSSVHAEIVLGANLTLSSVTTSSTWQGDGEGGIIDLYTDVNKSGSFDIGTFVIKAGNVTTGANTSVSLSNIVLSDASFDEFKFNANSVSIRIPSSTNTLDSLTVSGATFNFSSSKTTYDLTVNDTKTTISAVKTDNSSSVTGTGEKSLNYGKNTFVVTVTAENGSKKEYTLNITRPDNRSANNNLSSLSLSTGKITFKPSTTSYSINVEENISSITISAELDDSKASFVNGYGPRKVNLNHGNNAIQIKVKAENGTEKTYTINVNRKSPEVKEEEKEPVKSNVNVLKELYLSKGSIDFKEGTKTYKVEVPYAISELEIIAKAKDNKATVSGTGNKKLTVGENKFDIVVTAENGEKNTYSITITRKEQQNIDLDADNYLKELTIEGYDISFDKNKTNYEIELKDDVVLNINTVTVSSKSTVSIIGNEDLKIGNEVKIIVTAEAGNTRIYTIKLIESVKEETDDNSLLPIGIAVFGFSLVILTASIIYAKKKRNN